MRKEPQFVAEQCLICCGTNLHFLRNNFFFLRNILNPLRNKFNFIMLCPFFCPKQGILIKYGYILKSFYSFAFL